MRLRRLAIALAAAIAPIALTPPGASAFKHPSPNDRCRVDINVAPRVITAGDPIVIWGRLDCQRPGTAANRVVRLFHHLRGVPGFSYVQSTTTDVNGYYEIENADSPVETNREFVVRSHGAQSASKAVRVEADVVLNGPPEGTQLYTGHANAVTFTGTVAPADNEALVVLQRQNAATGDEWHSIQRGVVETNGTFSITHVFRYPGDANIRVLVRSQGRNIPSRSNILTYEISQAQNPKLTIASSADPITFGQAATISGTLVGGADSPVTLYARTAGQHFAAIAQVNTDSEGNYTFPSQAPVDSTFYRVEGMGRRSAVLYEGVRVLLTASVSRTTVPAGQPVVFSGAVAPNHAGDVVYLERRDARGIGYHVIQVGLLGADSTYTIEHRFYDAGTKNVRIYVPGGPLNGAGASAPFAIEVTPVPAAALTPEASSNISLPSEGKLNGAGGEEAATEGLETEAGPTEAPTPTETKRPKAGETEAGAPKEGKTKKGKTEAGKAKEEKAKEGSTGEAAKGGSKEAQGAQEPQVTVHRRRAR
jgi:hypothetical protein